MSITDGPELRGRLRGNDVIVTVKIEGALSLAVVGRETHGGVALIFYVQGSLVAPRLEIMVAKARLEQICAGKIVVAGRILRGNGDQLGNESGHFVLMVA